MAQTLTPPALPKVARNVFLLAAVLALPWAASAQSSRIDPPQNMVALQAQASMEVQQDLLTMSMNTTRDGSDASAVQVQLKAALDAALVEARKVAQPGELDVRTGNFSLYPRHGRDGKVVGWQGSTELILEGRDFSRISALAGRINTLTLGHVGFALSREGRARVEAEVTAQAIDRFRTKAQEVSKAFGFTGYTIRDVNVNTNDQGFSPRPRMMAMEARAMAVDAAVPVEAGRSTVVVNVGGSVQMK